MDKVIKTLYKGCVTISPIQMYQRETAEHLPLGLSLTEVLTTTFIVWLRSKWDESEWSRLIVRPWAENPKIELEVRSYENW